MVLFDVKTIKTDVAINDKLKNQGLIVSIDLNG